VIDMKTGTVTRTISLGQYTRPHGVMFFPRDEKRVVVTSEATRNLVIVNLERGEVEGAIPTDAQGSHMVAITHDGKRAFTSNVGSGSVSELDLEKRAGPEHSGRAQGGGDRRDAGRTLRLRGQQHCGHGA
jgi:DNA-binding beta-propeller fold protein YncE